LNRRMPVPASEWCLGVGVGWSQLYTGLVLSGTCTYVDPKIATPSLIAIGTFLSE
jgi:hypothetical protein